jgi:hypothetical protein
MTKGLIDLTPMWSGQSACLARDISAKELTQRLAEETVAKLQTALGRLGGEPGDWKGYSAK